MAHQVKRLLGLKKSSGGVASRFKQALGKVVKPQKKGIAKIVPGLVRINRPTGGFRSIAQQIAGVGKRRRTGGGTPGISGALGVSESSPGSGIKRKLG